MTFLLKVFAITLVLAMAQAKPGWGSSSSSSSSSSSGSSGGAGYNGGYGGQGFQAGYQPGFQSFNFPDFGFGFPGAYPQQFQTFGYGDYDGGLGVRLGAGPGVQSVQVGASQHSTGNRGSYSSSSSSVDGNGNIQFQAEKGTF
ncbi:Hypothetical predicted protein [Cloeon dipterum]|uniref:Uncharacterized protein n=1 Tax=Cloeon dipterum TaxID=197152 RepID=A0A8S1D369_9INSE|nr:Hypothetical predicted protein [Cloeon dipterum]